MKGVISERFKWWLSTDIVCDPIMRGKTVHHKQKINKMKWLTLLVYSLVLKSLGRCIFLTM